VAKDTVNVFVRNDGTFQDVLNDIRTKVGGNGGMVCVVRKLFMCGFGNFFSVPIASVVSVAGLGHQPFARHVGVPTGQRS
jgi:hypothetical protein